MDHNNEPGLPPAYEHIKAPLEPVNYAFSPQQHENTMLLVPPSSLPDSRPQYHISVALNVFNPFSFTTTIRRGGTSNGPKVGEFEMGISSLPGIVTINGVIKFISEVVVEGEWGKHTWKFDSQDTSKHIFWNRSPADLGLYNCYLDRQYKVKIAQYQGHTFKRRPAETTLRVYPEGQKHFDDIVISILILERMRLRPGAPKTNRTPGANFMTEASWWS
ncbi:hypothetical protein MKEN_01067800 [Mycena kentingensis (nom. inval.)]|nr:hypothetical protein MKEN_01067800 [Mycena kentingensis (nom. inval.)]